MDKNRLKKFITYFLIITIFFVVLSVVFSFHAIYTGVKNICVEAKREFGQDCVQSLMLYIRSDDHNRKDKRHAVWALGQLADKDAISFLEDLQKEYGCQEDPKKSKICYEIYKAIKGCTCGNVTSWMYKNKENW
ncbi:MAG: hypothetical protein P9M09_01185 [Candidatus Celaenobacter antarcticus]|nr:hypothetical protein [Candidatus Celaenobacter antarcticus]